MHYTSLESQDKGGGDGFLNKYKKPIVFLLSTVSIVAIVLIIVFLLLDHTGRPSDDIEKYEFTIDSIFNSSLSPKSFSLKWDPNNPHSYLYKDTTANAWYRKGVNSNSSSLFLNVTELQNNNNNIKISDLIFSPDLSLVLLSFNVTKVWRHSFVASYKVYNVATKAVTSLVAGDPQLQSVTWNPVNHKVAYVLDNDIFFADASNPSLSPITVTDDGNVENGILNGIQSWVYEEEIFSDFRALWWSNDGNYISYLRFDESDVPIFEFPMYYGSAYPTQIPLRYPKAGYENPQVSLKFFDINNSSSFPSFFEFGGEENEWEYIASVQWGKDNSLWIQTLNRYQNLSNIIIFSRENNEWRNHTVSTQTSSKWIEIHPLFFCSSFNLSIQPNGDNFHIISFSQNNNNWQSTFLSSGNYDVISLEGCSSEGKLFYHATPVVDATNPVAATLQHVYYYNFVDSSFNDVSKGTGVFSISSFSPLGDYFIINYLGPFIPKVYLLSSDLLTNVTVEDNKIYEEIIKHYDFPVKKYVTVKGEAGDVLNAVYKRPFLDAETESDIPLIIDVYAGPGTQRVQQVHKVGGLDAWLAVKGYGVASIDGRGTGRRGLNFLQQTYRQLGLLEIADQRAGAKELTKIGHFDDKKVVLWGWSFGGFMAAHGAAKTSAIADFEFNSAVSVAPVTDWRFYDSVYTERFMSTPQDNPNGYNITSVLQHAQNTPSNTLLLMHGTGDDNVHFQNTVELANVLIKNDIQFETLFFPNDDHSINTDNDRRYLYEKMTHFLEERL